MGRPRRKLSTKRKIVISSSSNEDDDVRDPDFDPQANKSLKQSLSEYTESENIARLHANRLKALMKMENCDIVKVPQDGNCLFTATVLQLEDSLLTPTILRNVVANYMIKQFDVYKAFLDGMTYKEYCKQVWRTKQPGAWNTALADIIPNAISNIFRRKIRIYSSNEELPVLNIIPESKPTNNTPLLFAVTAIPQREHYDICRPIADKRDLIKKGKNVTKSEIYPPVTKKMKASDETVGGGNERDSYLENRESTIGRGEKDCNMIGDGESSEAVVGDEEDEIGGGEQNDARSPCDGDDEAKAMEGSKETVGGEGENAYTREADDASVDEGTKEAVGDEGSEKHDEGEKESVANLENIESKGGAGSVCGMIGDGEEEYEAEGVEEIYSHTPCDGDDAADVNEGITETDGGEGENDSDGHKADEVFDEASVDEGTNELDGSDGENEEYEGDFYDGDGEHDGYEEDKEVDACGRERFDRGEGENEDGGVDGDDEQEDSEDESEIRDQPVDSKKTKEKGYSKQQLRKQSREKGENYVTKKGKNVIARGVKKCECMCRFGCNEISQDERQTLFDEYWSLANYERQRDFILKHVEHKQSSVCIGALRKRSSTREFYIKINEAKRRVCKSFFLSTFDIGKKVIDVAIKKQQEGGSIVPDQRGRHQTSTKIPDDQVQIVHDHIRSFPTMLSHYCRKDTAKQYLDSSLNVQRMYRLYIEKCNEDNTTPVKLHFYRKQFQMYNLSFHKKTKDQCAKCTKFENIENPTTDEEADYNKHINNKTLSREEKSQDKELAKNDERFSSATFDLQSILVSPCSNVSSLYYSRKLQTYNLSVYTQESGRGACYVWHEYNGKRGANEIGTCISKYAQSFGVDSPVRELSMFSDSCAGQNRNQYTMSALVYSVRSSILDVMHLKFLETGHTQMEVDSIHAIIERRKKAVEIQIPDDWLNVIRTARASRPYIVEELSHGQFLDFKEYTREILRSAKIDSTGNKIKWNEIRWLKYDKNSPDVIFYNYSFEASDLKMIKLGGHTRSSGPLELAQPTPCYQTPIPVSVLKKKDILQLCQKGLIKQQYHQFYADLETDKNAVDRLPEPDIDEGE